MLDIRLSVCSSFQQDAAAHEKNLLFISPDHIKEGMLQKRWIHETLNSLPPIYPMYVQ